MFGSPKVTPNPTSNRSDNGIELRRNRERCRREG
jgi:hypothetical protein